MERFAPIRFVESLPALLGSFASLPFFIFEKQYEVVALVRLSLEIRSLKNGRDIAYASNLLTADTNNAKRRSIFVIRVLKTDL